MKTKNKEIFSIVLRAVVALAIFVAVVLNYDVLVNLDLRVLVGSMAVVWYAYLAVIGVYALKSVVFVVPAMMIYLSVGMSFETSVALVLNLIGLAVEITITFFLGRFLGKEYVTKLLEKNKAGQKLLNVKAKTKNSFLFLVRFTGMPIDFTSLFLGASDFKFIPYFFVSLLGIYPRVLVFTIIGDSIYKYIPKDLIIKLVIGAIPLAVIGFIIFKVVRKRKK